MKYEIVTDTEDMLVLIVNSRVIVVSQDMSVIMNHIWDSYQNFMKRNKKLEEPALIYPELHVKEDKVTKEEIKENKPTDSRTTWEKLLDLGVD